jgi:hypothetical protein
MKIESLSAECINYRARHFDFFNNDYGDKWKIGFELTEEQDIEDYIPLMNYIYALPDNFKPSKLLQEQLSNTTLICLPKEERYYLALTGGGMDLSWEICESYINLDYLPPLEFCDLPAMAGKKIEGINKEIVLACIRSCEIASKWSNYRIARLKEYLQKEQL